LGNPINGGPKFLYLPLNLTLTLTLTLLTLSTLITLLKLPTLITLLLSTVFNMVQEFGTAVYRIAKFCPPSLSKSSFAPSNSSVGTQKRVFKALPPPPPNSYSYSYYYYYY